MARITKAPDERRNELMDVAEQLFVEKGYDHTSPSDIIRSANVAQGTFYYYFGSKDEIIKAIIDRYFKKYEQYVEQVAGDESIDTARKLQLILEALIDFPLLRKKFGKIAYNQPNISNHRGYGERMGTKVVPIIKQIVRQGVEDGLFKTEYPEEASEMLVMLVKHVRDELKQTGNGEAGLKKVEAARAIMENLLCAPPGTFRSQP